MHARRSESGEREEGPGAVGQRARQYHRTQHTGRKLERGKKQQRGREGDPGPRGSDGRREFCGRALRAGDVSERAEDTRTFSSSQVLAPSPRLSGCPLRLLAVLAVTTCTEALHRPCPVHNHRERARQRRRRASSPRATDRSRQVEARREGREESARGPDSAGRLAGKGQGTPPEKGIRCAKMLTGRKRQGGMASVAHELEAISTSPPSLKYVSAPPPAPLSPHAPTSLSPPASSSTTPSTTSSPSCSLGSSTTSRLPISVHVRVPAASRSRHCPRPRRARSPHQWLPYSLRLPCPTRFAPRKGSRGDRIPQAAARHHETARRQGRTPPRIFPINSPVAHKRLPARLVPGLALQTPALRGGAQDDLGVREPR